MCALRCVLCVRVWSVVMGRGGSCLPEWEDGRSRGSVFMVAKSEGPCKIN